MSRDKKEEKILCSSDVAERLGISVRRAQTLLKSGRIKSMRINGMYLVNSGDLLLYKAGKNGRPKAKI